jgi:hypothetical protein
LQPRLMTNQLSSIRTSFVRALFNTAGQPRKVLFTA